jgi:hemerythrin-like domain-containing protein
MELDELVSVLVSEHVEMKERLAEVGQATLNRDFASASKYLQQLDRLFRQHIADEEGQVLRILIDAYGVKGAEDAIIVFRQHKPIHELVEEIKKLAGLSVEELAADEERLRNLLENHTLAEEARIFPKAVSTHRGTKEGVT